MSDLNFYLRFATLNKGKAKILKEQHQAVTEGRVVACARCDLVRDLALAYKCLYCGLWFCFPCAEKHFKMTVEEYHADTEVIKRRIEERAKLEKKPA